MSPYARSPFFSFDLRHCPGRPRMKRGFRRIRGTAAEHAVLIGCATRAGCRQQDATTPSPPAAHEQADELELLFRRLKDGRVKLADAFPV